MSFWSSIGDFAASVVTKPFDVVGSITGSKKISSIGDKLYSSSTKADQLGTVNAAIGKLGATVAGVGALTSRQTTNAASNNTIPSADAANNAIVAPYKREESILETVAKAFGGTINLDKDGRVTGSVSVGTEANPTAKAVTGITEAFAKYWWVLLVFGGLVLIFRRGRR